MKHKIYMQFAFVVIVGVVTFNSPVIAQKLKAPERGFISSEAAETWEHGLISGNGTIGANVMSRPLDEIIIFSHERLFLPMGKPVMPPDNANRLFEIRRLIDHGLYKQATALAFDLSGQEGFMYPDNFVPAFDLNIKMETKSEIKDYMRSVDFQTGETTVHWADSRKYFSKLSIMSTLGIKPPGSCHFSPEGYAEFARLIWPLVERDNYGKVFTKSITPPNIKMAYYESNKKDEIVLEFDQRIIWTDSLKSQFYFDGENELILSGTASVNKIIIKLKKPLAAKKITYLDSKLWSQDKLLYGENGIAALTFWNVPIMTSKSGTTMN